MPNREDTTPVHGGLTPETTGADPTAHDRVDPTVAHPARRYNYWLGGKDNFAADRASGDAIASAFPSIRQAVVENRYFLQRVVTHLAHDAGIRQFLDIGTGLPTANNTHEIAQSIAPESRIVYVDNDPIVLVHAQALMNSSPEGATVYIDADLHDPEAILDHPQLHATLDLSQPVGLLLIAILQFIDDTDDPHSIVVRLTRAMAAGSYLAISHPTFDGLSAETVARLNAISESGGSPFFPRTRAKVARFFDGTDLIAPGLTSIVEWHAEHQPRPRASAADTAMYGAVGRLP
ncbi:MAG TPA: SAM-dependent methyltransferase [Micromonosporaceae bacterium]|nr:SAM-dependent methyltransferase [Micromonosporaceae bacterium]